MSVHEAVQGPKVEFWFRDGHGHTDNVPCDCGGPVCPQRLVVQTAFRSLLTHLPSSPTLHLACLSTHYLPLLTPFLHLGPLHPLHLHTLPPTHPLPTSDDPTLTPLTLPDLPAVQRNGSVPYAAPYLTRQLTSPPESTLSRCLCLHNGTPVSWVGFHANLSVGLMATEPEHRGKGYAKKVLGAACAGWREWVGKVWPGKQGPQTMRVFAFVEEDNKASRAVCAQVGFVETGERNNNRTTAPPIPPATWSPSDIQTLATALRRHLHHNQDAEEGTAPLPRAPNALSLTKQHRIELHHLIESHRAAHTHLDLLFQGAAEWADPSPVIPDGNPDPGFWESRKPHLSLRHRHSFYTSFAHGTAFDDPAMKGLWEEMAKRGMFGDQVSPAARRRLREEERRILGAALTAHDKEYRARKEARERRRDKALQDLQSRPLSPAVQAATAQRIAEQFTVDAIADAEALQTRFEEDLCARRQALNLRVLDVLAEWFRAAKAAARKVDKEIFTMEYPLPTAEDVWREKEHPGTRVVVPVNRVMEESTFEAARKPVAGLASVDEFVSLYERTYERRRRRWRKEVTEMKTRQFEEWLMVKNWMG
ncbi:hypothetical protein HDU96_002461 [Phlyctochytrium bullatum]|nr:hypothetical protein HDU96_002461 [Phlyctochytrium bullatum]